MNAIFLLSTGLAVTVFLVFAAATWRLYRGQGEPRPVIEYVLMATVFGAVASQAFTWLGAGHPEASQARSRRRLLQLIAGSGIAGVMVICTGCV